MPKTPEINLELVEILKRSRVYQTLNEKKKRRYMELLGQIVDDTDGEMTQTEYENLVALSFICEEFETVFFDQGFEAVDPRLFSEYRRAKEIILMSMNKNREGRLASKDTIKDVKEVLLEMKKQGGLTSKVLGLPNDNTDVRATTPRKNRGRPRKVVDSNAVKDADGTGEKT
jgi:hypothetical protein